MDLAGGTLDIWPLYLMIEDCSTVNLAIDIRTRATLIPRKDGKIILTSEDTNVEQTFKSLDDLRRNESKDLSLLKVHAKFWNPKSGFELITRSDSPVGAGLAASSSLNISLCGAFNKWTGNKIPKERFYHLAGNLEAQVIRTPTGCQDYFPATFGGLNFIKLTAQGPTREAVRFNDVEFEKHFVLVYTGRPHHSGLNNWQIFKSVIEGDRNTLKQFGALRDVSLNLQDAIRAKKWKVFGSLFQKEYEARVGLSKVFSSPEIERLKSLSSKSGAEALKICGAGGGGCVFLWCKPEIKDKIRGLCHEQGFQVLAAKPVSKGLEVKVS